MASKKQDISSGFNAINYANLTDEILFNRYIGGDIKAFDELLTRHKGLLYSFVLRYVKVLSEADEIFQEVFFKVCRNKDQFRESISFKSWLVTICKNTCIDYLRKKKRTIHTETLDGDTSNDRRQLIDILSSEDSTPDESLTIQIENENLEELLDKLPLEQKETFYMKVVMEFTFEEIGLAMKCSTNTAKSRYRYALSALRALVKRRIFLEKAV
ncbi:MAG: sigma-70 family RNA polymerase sigma factor [Deltaproteobacteria bacterium]|nr:sigma-70 family RNA polymerase sigma factor [Deltaproteobacteria bacterium]